MIIWPAMVSVYGVVKLYKPHGQPLNGGGSQSAGDTNTHQP